MENNRTLTPIELNIVELFERLQNANVAEDSTFKGTFYVDYPEFQDIGLDWVTESREDLLNYCIDGINQWYSETDTTDMLNNDFILEDTLDYLQLLLTLPSDTTILAVGNGGAVSAPSTTTGYLHRDYYGNQLLAIYDYEAEDTAKAMKADLCELFPLEPPKWLVILKNGNGQRQFTEIAETKAEAVKMALDEFNNNMCDWLLWDSIEITEITETQEPEKPKADYTELIAVTDYEIRKAINKIMNHFADSYTVTENLSDSQKFELDIATNHITYAVADSIAETLNIK